MFTDSAIDPATIQAYLETEYRTLSDPPLTLRVGEANAGLIAAQARHGASSSAFLTAWNPYSQEFDGRANEDRQRSLTHELDRRRLTCVPGIGQHPTGSWPGEPSLLVFGLDLPSSRELGTRFEQNAIVWSDRDGVPQLILLR